MLRKPSAVTTKQGFLDGMPPVTSFVFGLVTGILIFLVGSMLLGG